MVEAHWLETVVEIASAAGREIMMVYKTAYEVVEKLDGSPLTMADQTAHDLISCRLAELTPNIPQVSEESLELNTKKRLEWSQLWLIDPLDGTKEFIRQNGEFTVNIALIEDGRPVLGVVHSPVYSVSHFAVLGQGAWRQIEGCAAERIMTQPYDGGAARMATSRSHSSRQVERFRKTLEKRSGQQVEAVVMGSSKKICLVAEGAVDVYPRLGSTSEWDTGAAHCILNEAGGCILDCQGRELHYNKQDMRNPWFIAIGDRDYDWINICSHSVD